MKGNFKKIISVFLTFAMLCSASAAPVWAEEEDISVEITETAEEQQGEKENAENPDSEPEETEEPQEVEEVVYEEGDAMHGVDTAAVLEEVLLSEEGGEAPEEVTIEEISIAEAREAIDETIVTVNGVVTKSADGYWYIQDAEAGIAVSTSASVGAGNVVKVSGIVCSEDNLKYIEAASLEVLSQGEGMPAPVEATVREIYDGKYQGMLVNIIGSKIVSMDSENITIRDDDEATVIQVVYSSELNNGLIKDAKVDVLAIATARTNNHIIRMTEKSNMTISVVPSEIGTEEELDAIRNNMYGNYILTDDIELTKYWVPIGTADRPFYGKINGNGHTVSGMDIQLDLEYWYQYAGFVGYAGDGAKIEKLTVTAKEGGSVKAKTQSGNTYAGGIVGYGMNTTIDNCVYSGVVEDAAYAGVIIGCGEGTSVIKNCTDIEVAEGSVISGGIAGCLYGTIENCSVVSGKVSAGSRQNNVGGIVGLFKGTMTSCYVTADLVEGNGNERGVGGAIGYAYDGSVISNCYSTADVIGANTNIGANHYGTGGFVGYIGKSGSITNCYATGDVTGKGLTGGFAGSSWATITDCYATGNVNGTDRVGGFVGIATGTADNCYAKGNVKGNDYLGGFAGIFWSSTAKNSHATGNVYGNNNVGGFTGYSIVGNYEKCYSRGDVRGVSKIGGFVGYMDSFEHIAGPGTYSYGNATASECFSSSNVFATEYAGGFAGYIERQDDYYVTLNNCYTYDGIIYGKSYAGGFAGYITTLNKVRYCYSNNRIVFDSSAGFSGGYDNTNGITRCYFNKEINPGETDSAAAGKTTQQLKERATYLDWDFLNTWEITPGFNNNLPYLRSLEGAAETEIEYTNISTEDELNNIRYDAGKNYRLTRDIELTKPWVPVESFYGIFDGNGFSIQNLTMADKAEYSYENGGLFSNLELGAVVKNLTVKGDVENTSTSGTGAILAGVSYGYITDCHVIGTVDAKNAGGIVSTNYGYIGNSDANVTVTGSYRAGGFVCVNDRGNIENCLVSGNVKCSENTTSATATGGFAAYVNTDATFLNCRAVCDVTGGNNTGGFIGYVYALDTQIRACSSEGKTVGVSSVGGFIGTMYSNSGRKYARIYDSFSKGSVYSSGENAGGFVGDVSTRSSQSFYAYIYNSYTTANVKGNNNVGGFVGGVDSYYAYLYAYDCYAADGKIVGNTNVGGFLGYKQQTDYSEGAAEFTRCLSRSYVTANSSSFAFAHSGKLERCYYDNERSLVSDAVAVGKTSEQLKDSATYLDWDFATVWGTSEDINGGYPYLRSIEEFSGEDTEYTLIKNEQDLINIRYNLEGKYKLANDISLKYNWIPIGSGTDKNTFNGVLDGDGYTIYGFNVPCDEEYEFEFAAMFASISPKAVIQNLNIVCRDGGGVKTKNFGSTNKNAAGFVVNNYGVIKNCSFTGSVSSENYTGGIATNNYNTIEDCRVQAESIYGKVYAGGIAATNSARIAECSFGGNLSCDGWNIGECFVGGIVAKNTNHISYCEVKNAKITGSDTMGGIAGYSENNVYNCSVTDSQIKQNTNTDDNSEAGGIVGYNKSKITGCSVTDTSIISAGNEVGGIAGESQGSIYNCTVDASIGGISQLGGLIGFMYTGTLSSSTADVYIKGTGDHIGGAVGYATYNYASMTIIGVKTAGTVEGVNHVGGILGYGQGYDNSKTIRDSHSSADIYAKEFAGGLIGSAWPDNGYSQATVTNCSASGNVFGTGGAIGGLIGKNRATVSNCYATGSVNGTLTTGGLIGYNLGSVKTSYARGDVIGRNCAGGLIGENSAPVQFTYATGYVFGENHVGGVAGYNSNSILNSYYDKETTGQSDTGKGIPKATFELMQQMNYVSWDFDNVWTRRDNYNDGYAYLTTLAPEEDADKTVIEISTEADLRNVENNLKGEYVLTKNIVLTGVWKPIGNYEHAFKGTFDGNGFTISGVSIPENGDAYVGFFGVVSGSAKISNLTIETAENGVINATSTNSYVGGLAGYNMGKISNCFVNGAVTGQGSVGGLVGRNDGVVTYSGTSGTVNGITDVGGLVGRNGLSVTRSYSSSTVAGTTNVGGVIGNNAGNVTSSYATGNVSAREKIAGGFVGKNTGTISGCSASNNVSAVTNTAGGFVGWNSGSGAVVNNSSASSVVSGNTIVGGFIGENSESASVNNCYSGGAVNATSSYKAGFAGYNCNKASITNCYTNSAVTGSNSNKGGFSGYNNATITNCYFDSTALGFTTSYGGTALTTTQMYTPSSYSGWDFDSVWQFDAETPGYPYLAWQTERGQAPSVIPAVNVTVNAPKKEISVGEAITLTATLIPASATDNILWSSSDMTTVAVSSTGVIIGMKAGKATITVRAGSVEASVEITVADKQVMGNIISVNTIADIHIPFGSTLSDAEAVLPGAVSVVLDNATLISLPVTWTLTENTEYEFEGTIMLNDSITNTEDKKAVVKVIVDEELRAPANITEVSPFELSVSYGTVIESVLCALPESIEVTLSDGTTEKLMISWNTYSEPEYYPYEAGVYVISGQLILPNNGTVVNPDNLMARADITVEPMPEKVRNITGAVANQGIEVAYGTDLTAVKSLLPGNAYAVVEGPITVSMPVAWSAAAAPEYNKFVAGTYMFTGTFLMPEDGMITNTSDIKTTVVVTVLPSTVESKTLYVSETIGEIGHIAESSVSIEEKSGMAAGSFCIAFDNSKLTPIDYKVGELIESSSVMVNMNYINPETNERMVKVSFIGNDAITKGGELIKVSYLVNSELDDNTEIPVSVSNVLITDISNVPLPVETVSGKITALQIILGDVTGDGAVNIMDAFKIMRYDVGFITLTEREALAADVDKNGEIDVFDALRIQKFDIGLSDGLAD